MQIKELSEIPEIREEAIRYFWDCWGSETNFPFYKNCIENSLDDSKTLPKFFVVINEGKIIGSYALLVNDLVSRQDLMPWFACLFVDPEFRGRGIAEKLLNHALGIAREKGVSQVYLSTDHEDFYEKKGWHFYDHCFNVFGDRFKIYAAKTD